MLKPGYKFTAGEWEVMPPEEGVPYIRIRNAGLGYRYKIANILTPVYDGAGERELQETLATAHLMAASPRLLALLEDMFKPVPMGRNPKTIFFERRRNAEAFLNELKPKLQGEQK